MTHHTLRDGAVAAVSLYRTRLELLLLDLEEEKERIEQRLILSVVAAFLVGLGSLVTTALLVAALWPALGLWAIGIFALLYLGSAGAVILILLKRNADRHRTFACTLREFDKDAERFAGALDGNCDKPAEAPRSNPTQYP